MRRARRQILGIYFAREVESVGSHVTQWTPSSPLTTRFTDKAVIVAFAPETRTALVSLTEMIKAGEIGPIVDRIYPMEEVADAHRLVETEKRLGAVVLAIAGKTQASDC